MSDPTHDHYLDPASARRVEVYEQPDQEKLRHG
jgi:hypothetical protein